MAEHKEAVDWPRGDVIAALKRKKTNLSKLSRESGYASTTLANALDRKWPKGQQLIAEALDISPSDIWPTRYGDNNA
ncbi:helix-turn-helix domain-containing protein [Citrobacter freundii]|nr:helix-turn-helix domain-containing protein [Citrobacter freundii]